MNFYARVTVFLLSLVSILLTACSGKSYSTDTPENCHNAVVTAIRTHDFGALYTLIDTAIRSDVRTYFHNTRSVLSMIDSSYPASQHIAARGDLTLRFSNDSLTMAHFEKISNDTILFSDVSSRSIGNVSWWENIIQAYRAHAEKIIEEDGFASVITSAGDTVLYQRYNDGKWYCLLPVHTFWKTLATVSRQNLEVTRRNSIVFSSALRDTL